MCLTDIRSTSEEKLENYGPEWIAHSWHDIYGYFAIFEDWPDKTSASESVVVLLDLAEAGYLERKGVSFRVIYSHLLPRWEKAMNDSFTVDGYVYLLGGGGYYKIGRTKEIGRRIRELAINLPWKTETEHIIPCQDYVSAEKTLHQMFASRRQHGEWFLLGETEVNTIKDIKRMRGADIEWA